MKKITLLLILFLGFSIKLYSQLSDLHYLPPLKQTRNRQSITWQAFYISTPEQTPFTVQVFQGNSLVPLDTFEVSNANPVKYDVPNSDNDIVMLTNINTGVVISNSGLRFESLGGEEFYVNFRGRSGVHAASLTSKGRKALGTIFKWGGIPNRKISNDRNATLGIMATEDNTTVTISDYDPNCTFRLGNDAQGITEDEITRTLNKGDSFVLEAIFDGNPVNQTGYLGATIKSDKKIAISNGNLNAGVILDETGRDAGIDQPVPENVLGTDYIFVRGNGIDETEFPVIIATQDRTDIFVNGSPTPIATLNTGDYFEIPGSNYNLDRIGGNMYVKASKPVYAYQVLAGSEEIQTIGLNFIAPVSCSLPTTLDNISNFKEVANLDFDGGGITIIAFAQTPDAAIQVTDDQGAVALPPSNPVPGNPNWKTFFVSNIDGNVSVNSTGPIAVGFLGANNSAGVAGYFSGFDNIPFVELDISGPTCIPGVELLEATGSFNTYQWFLNGVAIPGATTNTYSPTVPGSYFLRVNLSDCPFDSPIIEVESIIINPTKDLKICDDTINDGIGVFDLDAQTPIILGTQSNTDNIVTYYASFTDADTGTNPLVSPYTNITNPQPIYVRIERVDDSFCSTVTEDPAFNLVVNLTEDANFDITPSCNGAIATITGTVGGVFSFNPIPTDGATIDPAIGEITNGVTGATYTVEYTIQGACKGVSSKSVTLLGQDNTSFNMTPTCNGGTATITGSLGGTFRFNPEPTDGATIDPATGEITNGLPGTTYTVQYTTQGVCSGSSIQTVTLLDQDDASFNMTPTCNGGTATITGVLAGVFSFNPEPTDGATIDPAKGEVTNGISGTTYTIEYITIGACSNSSIQTVTILEQDDAAFNLVPNCNGGTAIIAGTIGGAFSFNPEPTDGALIDVATGEITNGIPNTTYNVEYTTGGACPDTSTQSVTVLNKDNASFNLTPSCSGGTAAISGTTGGLFSFNPKPTDGSTINPATGEITNGVSGITYTIEYTTQGVCPDIGTQNVTILDQDDASFIMTPSCNGATATVNGTLGGVFSLNPNPTDGAIIDANTGEISNGMPSSTYNVEYTTEGICPNSLIVSTQSLPPGNALFTITPNCDGGESIISGSSGGVFSFNPIPTDGALIDAVTGLVTNGTTGSTYTIVYTVENCFSEHSENLTVLPQFQLDVPSSLPSCDDTTPGEFAFFDLESKNMEILETSPYTSVTYHDTQIEANDGINPIASPYFSASRIIFARAQKLSCYSTTTLELEVIQLPTIKTATYSVCDDTIELDNDTSNDSTTFNLTSQNPIILNGQDPTIHNVSYYLSQADAESGINPLTNSFTNTINPQTIYTRVQNENILCFITSELVLQVNPLPAITLEDNYILCIDNDGNVVLPTPIIDTGLNPTEYSFKWELNGVPIAGETNSTINFMQSGNYSVTAVNIITGCEASAETVAIESAAPVIEAEQISTAFIEDNTILATATNNSISNAVFEFKIDNGPWVSNVPNNNTYIFENVSGGEHIITARDINGCGEASTLIIVLDFIPYFTPNGDGFHDNWNIIGLENQPEAELYIFNRYGKLLKQLRPSGSGWDGTFNNSLMPTSDYWFTLLYKDPNTNKTNTFKSHFTLKR